MSTEETLTARLDRSIEGPEMSSSTEHATVLPLEVIDKAIGTQIKILLTNNKEFIGKLVGFDDFVNVVLEDVLELDNDGTRGKSIKRMLLNGAQIAMLCPAL